MNMRQTIFEFSLNVLTEFSNFSDKNVTFIKDYSNQPPLEMLPRCQVTDRIFMRFPEFGEFIEFLFYLWKTPLLRLLVCFRFHVLTPNIRLQEPSSEILP